LRGSRPDLYEDETHPLLLDSVNAGLLDYLNADPVRPLLFRVKSVVLKLALCGLGLLLTVGFLFVSYNYTLRLPASSVRVACGSIAKPVTPAYPAGVSFSPRDPCTTDRYLGIAVAALVAGMCVFGVASYGLLLRKREPKP
jgi:hypothetical protein